MRDTHRVLLAIGLTGLVLSPGAGLGAQTPREVDVTANHCAYVVDGRKGPARITVDEDDLVRVTFTAEDIPHSFTIDEYRIAKRAAPGHPVTFEFRADRPGTFQFYCNLSIDSGCRHMTGELVVTAK